ncbi:MAG: hypothetical protein JKY14_07015, partial [Paraglaciecola sp.]|nr:hypothetical protein [Paraglaciecola sp.]
SGRGVKALSSFNPALTYVTDITPTILALTATPLPPLRYAGRPIEPMIGKSLVPLLEQKKQQVYGDEQYIGYEVGGNKALFNGDFKIVFNTKPFGDEQWSLFNISQDPGETQDLKNVNPVQFQKMLNMYQQYALTNNVLPVSLSYSQTNQVVQNTLRHMFAPRFIVGLLLIIILGGFYHFRPKR